MTTVKLSIVGADVANMTSVIEGISKEELQEVVDKLQDGFTGWKLIVHSKVSFSSPAMKDFVISKKDA